MRKKYLFALIFIPLILMCITLGAKFINGKSLSEEIKKNEVERNEVDKNKIEEYKLQQNEVKKNKIQRKEIKVKFVDDDGLYFGPETVIYKTLNKYYDVKVSDSPEYLFFSERSHKHLDYEDCIKIFYTEENYEPEFNLCDYAITFNNINYSDRHFRAPNWIALGTMRNYDKTIQRMKNKHIINKQTFLEQKTDFCSFVYSHGNGDPMRETFFKKLCSKYKKVNSGGPFLNNIGGPIGNWGSSNAKYDFDKKHKFSIAFENSSHIGYTTEKLIDAFAAQTVPIYWGDEEVEKVFNPKSFINVKNYSSLDIAIQKIKEIDSNHDLYLSMISTPALLDNNYVEKTTQDLEEFLTHIISQPYEEAFRRNRYLWGKVYSYTLRVWQEAYENQNKIKKK